MKRQVQAEFILAGLSVGVIREINSDAMGNLNYATVEPLVDFNKLYEVLVINGTY